MLVQMLCEVMFRCPVYVSAVYLHILQLSSASSVKDVHTKGEGIMTKVVMYHYTNLYDKYHCLTQPFQEMIDVS